MWKVNKVKAFFLALFMLSIAHTSRAAVLYVDDDSECPGEGTSNHPFCAIQSATEVATAGDAVQVAEGTYAVTSPDRIDVKAGVLLKGSGAENTIINGNRFYNIFVAENSLIIGFTVTTSHNGIYCKGVSATISDCVFKGGTGVLCEHGCNAQILNNRFLESGLRITNASAPLIQGNIIARTSTAIRIEEASPQIVNNTIAYNSEGISGISDSSTIVNNIIVHNLHAGISVSSAALISYNEVWNNYPDYDRGRAGRTNISLPAAFRDADNNDFHLPAYSPLIDRGDPASSYQNEPQPNGDRINLGAYGNTPEAAASLYVDNDLYVDADIDVPGDGLSWNTAMRSVTKAVSMIAPGHTVHVAAGTYTIASPDLIIMRPGIAIDGAGIDRSILEGDGQGDIVFCSDDGILEGVTVRKGQYGIRCKNASPVIRNCKIADNSYPMYIYDDAAPTIINCIIVGNTSEVSVHSAAPMLVNNLFLGNGIRVRSSSPVIESNTIDRARTGIYITQSEEAVIKNNIILNCRYSGISCSYSLARMSYNNFWQNGKAHFRHPFLQILAHFFGAWSHYGITNTSGLTPSACRNSS